MIRLSLLLVNSFLPKLRHGNSEAKATGSRLRELFSIPVLASTAPTNPCRVRYFPPPQQRSGLWTSQLAERVQEVRLWNRSLRSSVSDWNLPFGASALVQMGKHLHGQRYLGIVISRAMLREDWPAVRRTIELLERNLPQRSPYRNDLERKCDHSPTSPPERVV